VVLGLGNILLGDDGVGVRALETLQQRYHLPAEVEPVDGGVLGVGLLSVVEGASDLLIVDAAVGGRAPGSVSRLVGEAIPNTLALKMSMHQVGLRDVMALCCLRGTTPPRVVVWAIEPGTLEPGTSLSAAVSSQLDTLVQAVVDELASWGLDPTPRQAASDA
jgi:hydrogenase maturation protease